MGVTTDNHHASVLATLFVV